MKEIIKEYEVDLKHGKIYYDNEEVFKSTSLNNKKISVFIDDNITDDKSVKRILNAWIFIFGIPEKVITNRDYSWYKEKNIEYTISDEQYNDIIDKSDAILLITNEEENYSIDIVKQFYKEIYFIDFKKLVINDSFTLYDIFYINDNKVQQNSIKQPLRQPNNKYWLPKDYLIKL